MIDELKTRANALGFSAFGITRADARPDLPEKLQTALASGWLDGMDWMASAPHRRATPQRLWKDAKSVIMLGIDYTPDRDPLEKLGDGKVGVISVYARNRDYHELIKGRLKEIAGLLARRTGAEVKVFVDTAPVMEKPLAEAAGLGWQGKNTVLISRQSGAWLFLGAIFTDLDLPADAPHEEMCGSCTRCLDICPTHAFPAPFRLDASRCIAYLTNEHQGPIPLEFREAIGNRIYGCDDCLAVCPWNKFARATSEAKLRAREDLNAPLLAELAELDDAAFRKFFAGSPVKRIGRDRFLRNVMIALGNARDRAARAAIAPRLSDASPLVRGAAVWAISRHLGRADLAVLWRRHGGLESDASVLGEWRTALGTGAGAAALE
ncbi:MAG: tRNA epoxyqueuosine(34) reductase QueG [Cucumibacter sp.]